EGEIAMNRNRFGLGGAVLITMLLVGGGKPALAQNSPQRPRYVWTEKEAIVARAPELIAAPQVVDARWSPNGSRLVLVRKSPAPDATQIQNPPNVRVLLWSSRSRRTIEVWKRPMTLLYVDHLDWMNQGENVVLSLHWEESVTQTGPNGLPIQVPVERYEALFVDAVRGQVRSYSIPQLVTL